MSSLSLTLIYECLITLVYLLCYLYLLKILLLKLLATLEQLLVHLGQTCQFELHLLSSLSELRLPVLFAFIKFYGDLLKSSMHFLDCSLVLL